MSEIAWKQKARRDKKELLGICNSCNRKSIKGNTKCLYHLEQMALSNRKRYQKKKGEISERVKKRHIYRVANGICTQCGRLLETEMDGNCKKCFNCSELSHKTR